LSSLNRSARAIEPITALADWLILTGCELEGELDLVFTKLKCICLQLDFTKDNYRTLELAQKIYSVRALLDEIKREGINRIYFSTQDNIQHTVQNIISKNERPVSNAMLGVIVVLFSLTLACFVNAYQENNNLIKNGSRVVESLASQGNEIHGLDKLSDVYSYYLKLKNYQSDHVWIKRLGFYKGRPHLESVKNILMLSMHESFYKPISNILEEELSDKNEEGDLYFLLKLYLVLYYPEYLNDDYLMNSLSDKWLALSGSVLSKDQSESLIQMYFQHTSPSSRQYDQSLVNQVRQQLGKTSHAQHIYNQVKSTGLMQWRDISLEDLIETNDVFLLSSHHKIPGIYSLSAWYNFIEPEMSKRSLEAGKGDWVIDLPLNRPNVYFKNEVIDLDAVTVTEKKIRHLYFDEFKHAWLEMVKSIQVKENVKIDQAIKLASDSALLTQIISECLKNLKLIFREEILSQENLEFYLASLKKLSSELEALLMRGELEKTTFIYTKEILQGKNADSELKRIDFTIEKFVKHIKDTNVRESVRSLLQMPVQGVWNSLLSHSAQFLQKQWDKEVYSYYKDHIQGKFPHKRDGADVSMDAFTKFYHPTHGVFAKFSRELELFLEGEQTLTFSPEFKAMQKQATAISHAMFNKTSNTPSLVLKLYPQPMKSLSEVAIGVGKQAIVYRNGPQEWHKIKWRGEQEDQETYIKLISASQKNQGFKEFEGPWGLFHLLANSNLKSVNDKVYKGRISTPADFGKDYSFNYLAKVESEPHIF